MSVKERGTSNQAEASERKELAFSASEIQR